MSQQLAQEPFAGGAQAQVVNVGVRHGQPLRVLPEAAEVWLQNGQETLRVVPDFFIEPHAEYIPLRLSGTPLDWFAPGPSAFFGGLRRKSLRDACYFIAFALRALDFRFLALAEAHDEREFLLALFARECVGRHS
jgi:hypothetical protein